MWCPSHRQVLVNGIERLERVSKSNFDALVLAADAVEIIKAIKTGQPLNAKPENVEFFNSLQILYSERFVFSSQNDFSLLKDMLKTDPEVCRGRRIVEHTGKF
jgi:hypothetical protein